jgi:hypothetical protein
MMSRADLPLHRGLFLGAFSSFVGRIMVRWTTIFLSVGVSSFLAMPETARAKDGSVDRSIFSCAVDARVNPLYMIADLCIRLSYWTEARMEEETPHFADSAARWATRNDSDQRASYVRPSVADLASQ